MYFWYCDLDGVMTNFNGALKSHFQTNLENVPNKEIFDYIKSQPRFWYDLSPLHGSNVIWNAIKRFKPRILTGIVIDDPNCIPGKQDWVKKHLGLNQYRVICVRASEKKNYATPNSILIDDNVKNISEWTNQGGIGILHHYKDLSYTMDHIKKLSTT